jgi:phage tail protein X
MSTPVVHRSRVLGKLALVALTLAANVGIAHQTAEAGLGGRHTDPEQVVPLNQLAAEHREIVAEVIRDHTFHRQGEPDTFPCEGNLYLSLLNEPLVPLSLWKDLSDSPVQLQKVGPNRYAGSDGSGSTATWEFALRTPRLHVLLAYFNYVSPRGNARIDARIVLIVRASYVQDSKKEPFIQHNVEAFVKVDSMGWKTLARTVRPVIERVLEEQVREAGYFISLMSRLVVTYPNWAAQVIANQSTIDAATKQRFREVVAQNRKPGASSGRPVVAQDSQAAADPRRR